LAGLAAVATIVLVTIVVFWSMSMFARHILVDATAAATIGPSEIIEWLGRDLPAEYLRDSFL
jgi:hypothetical protein